MGKPFTYRDMIPEENRAFMERMRGFRREFHLTRKELAAAMGVNYQTIRVIEEGQVRPWLRTIEKFADVEEKYRRAADLEMESLEGTS